MSELIFNGDLVSKFGTYLPAPYISKVELLDDRVTTYISLFFVSSGDDDIDQDIVSSLNNSVNVYCMHTWAGPNDSEDFGWSESDWQSVLDGEVNIFKGLYDARQNSDISSFNLSQISSLAVDMNSTSTTWVKAEEESYTEQGQKIVRYQTTVDYIFNTTESSAFGTSLDLWFDDPPQFWYTYAFTSTYEYSEEDIEDQLENVRLLANKTSDISYEKVYSGS